VAAVSATRASSCCQILFSAPSSDGLPNVFATTFCVVVSPGSLLRRLLSRSVALELLQALIFVVQLAPCDYATLGSFPSTPTEMTMPRPSFTLALLTLPSCKGMIGLSGTEVTLWSLGRPPRAEDIAEDVGARVVTVDRPGMGASGRLDFGDAGCVDELLTGDVADFDSAHSYRTFASDVAELATHLGYDRFAVVRRVMQHQASTDRTKVGFSSGSVYALACVQLYVSGGLILANGTVKAAEACDRSCSD
jgi:hypothetical protein